jgi:hypothetical protein
MATAKDKVRRILEDLPPQATYEDIQYHIYVRQKTERGLKDIRAGRLVSQREIERRMSRWLRP